MRLLEFEKQAIKDSFTSIFSQGKVYLFGSRIDDNDRGGDIDLYLDVDYSEDINKKKIEFLVELKERIGDQKIDVIISRDKSRLIEKEALRTGIVL